MDESTGHYVICNWNERAFGMVIQLHSDVLRFHDENRRVTIINRTPVAADHLHRNYGKFFYDVEFHVGDPSDRTVLRSAGVESAECVVVLSEGTGGETADARTLLTYLALLKLREDLEARRSAAEGGPEGGEQQLFRVLLELQEQRSLRRFQGLLPTESNWLSCVVASTLDTMLFSQAARTPGLVSLFFDVLTFSRESNEIYRLPMPEPLALAAQQETGLTFGAAHARLLDERLSGAPLLLVGYARDGLLHTNPPLRTPLDEQCELLVLAREAPHLDDLLAQHSLGEAQ